MLSLELFRPRPLKAALFDSQLAVVHPILAAGAGGDSGQRWTLGFVRLRDERMGRKGTR